MLTRADIHRALDERGATYTESVYGFDLPDGWRIQSGGGIAGRGHAWAVVRYKAARLGDPPGSRYVETRKELHAILDACPVIPCRTCRGRGYVAPAVPPDELSPEFEYFEPVSAFPARCYWCGGTGHGPRRRRGDAR